MTKKYLILFSLLILMLGVVGFAIYKTTTNNKTVLDSVNNPNNVRNTANGQLASSEEQPFVSSTTKNQSEDISDVTSNVDAVKTIFNNKFPDLNIEQINSFLGVAVSGKMQDCGEMLKLNDQCIYYFALYKNAAGYCSEISNKKIQFDCYSELVFNNLSSKVNNCSAIKSALEKIICFQNIFWAVDDLKSCSIFNRQSVQIQQACLDSTIFELSMSQYKNDCANIKDTDIKNYCELRFK